MIYGSTLSFQAIHTLKERGIVVEIEKVDGLFLYRRKGGFPEDYVEKVTKVSGEEGFVIHPVHSIQPEVSTSLLLRLAKPLIVAPSSTVTIYVKAPINVGIYVVEKEVQRLIDSFNPTPYKYALYGPTSNGIICRFYRTDIFSKIPYAEFWEAITKITIENETESFAEIKNVVYPLLNADVYIDNDGRAYIEAARLQIFRDNAGAVYLENEPPLAGLIKCPKQFGELQEKVAKFIMEFGL